MSDYVYTITGFTNFTKWVCIGMYASPQLAKEQFIKKYPRFSGSATLKQYVVAGRFENVIVTEPCKGVSIEFIESTKQLKESNEKKPPQ